MKRVTEIGDGHWEKTRIPTSGGFSCQALGPNEIRWVVVDLHFVQCISHIKSFPTQHYMQTVLGQSRSHGNHKRKRRGTVRGLRVARCFVGRNRSDRSAVDLGTVCSISSQLRTVGVW